MEVSCQKLNYDLLRYPSSPTDRILFIYVSSSRSPRRSFVFIKIQYGVWDSGMSNSIFPQHDIATRRLATFIVYRYIHRQYRKYRKRKYFKHSACLIAKGKWHQIGKNVTFSLLVRYGYEREWIQAYGIHAIWMHLNGLLIQLLCAQHTSHNIAPFHSLML